MRVFAVWAVMKAFQDGVANTERWGVYIIGRLTNILLFSRKMVVRYIFTSSTLKNVVTLLLIDSFILFISLCMQAQPENLHT